MYAPLKNKKTTDCSAIRHENNKKQHYGLLSSSIDNTLQPIQRVAVKTPKGTIDTDNLNDEALDSLCQELKELAYSTRTRNQWETQYHMASKELLRRHWLSKTNINTIDSDSDDEGISFPNSFTFSEKTYNKKERSPDVYYQPDDFSKSSGSYVSIHDPTSGEFYTHSHTSRKKRCSVKWVNGKVKSITYDSGETEMTDETDRANHKTIAVNLGLKFLNSL